MRPDRIGVVLYAVAWLVVRHVISLLLHGRRKLAAAGDLPTHDIANHWQQRGRENLLAPERFCAAVGSQQPVGIFGVGAEDDDLRPSQLLPDPDEPRQPDASE